MSHNVTALFPKEHLDKLLAHARKLDPDDHAYRSDSLDEILNAFPTGGEFKRDSNEAYYVARQLEHIRAGVQAAEFPPLKAAILVPFDTTPDEGAETYTATYSKQAGRVRVSKDMRGIIPPVDIAVDQKSYPILSVLLSYGYTLQEVRGAIRERKPLPTDRAMRCREQIEREIDQIGLIGHSETGLKGLFTLQGTATYATPVGAGGKPWLLKTPEEVLKDWNGAVSQVVVATKEIERPNTSVLPTSNYEHVTTKRIGDGTSDTIATYFRRNNPHIKTVESSPYLEAAPNGEWAGKRTVHYEKSPLKLSMQLPVPFEQLSPDVTSTETNVTCHARTAGVVVHRPQSIIYCDET
ncbi:MAG: major capsid family protein [Kofleriaceae bacterium]